MSRSVIDWAVRKRQWCPPHWKCQAVGWAVLWSNRFRDYLDKDESYIIYISCSIVVKIIILNQQRVTQQHLHVSCMTGKNLNQFFVTDQFSIFNYCSKNTSDVMTQLLSINVGYEVFIMFSAISFQGHVSKNKEMKTLRLVRLRVFLYSQSWAVLGKLWTAVV